MILFQNYAGQWLPWTVSAFLFLCFIVPERPTIIVEGIRGYRFPQETEDYTIDDPSAMDVDIDPQLVGRSHPEAQHSTQRSNLRLFPPPIFSRQGLPQNYKYVTSPSHPRCNDFCFAYVPRVVVLHFSFKANPMSTVTTFVDEKTGEEKERLINKGRWKGFGPTSVSFAEKGVGESFCFVLSWDVGGCMTRCFSESLTLCMILRRSLPSPLQTLKKCVTSTINPLSRGWKR